MTKQYILGQYFTTSTELQEKVYSFILNKPSLILEPSMGRGDLINYVSERDKGDYNNLHAYTLIGTNTDMPYKEVKYGLGNISVGDYQPIYYS